MKRFHLHLVSDSTGETLEAITKACLAQFEGVEPVKHFWPMVRSERQVDRLVVDIAKRPGLVLYTLVNQRLRDHLQARLQPLSIPAVSVLDPLLQAFGHFIGEQVQGLPGRQHVMDDAYFQRIDAVHFTMAHDDGLLLEDLALADIILVGVSRTSKTPTAIYLANRGYKTANIPLVPNLAPPQELLALKNAFIVGLTTHPDRLLQVRQSRMKTLHDREDDAYIDPECVEEEIISARRLFHQKAWPVIDVSRRSIEETAAAVLNLYNQRQEKQQDEPI
jgi:[pyruvate, water dikinase]-phosphate phosphotransferase / [pyruvate, water dikinase] kinase